MIRRLAFLALVFAAHPVPVIRAQVRQMFDVVIPMRDGVRLAADLWLPNAPGRYPLILVRTPYLKTMEM